MGERGGATSSVAARSTAAGRTRAPNRTPDEVRSLLVAATVELLSEGPAGDVTVRAIASRAGVQHSLITRHFTSKDELIAVALGQLAADYRQVVEGGDGAADGYLRALDHLRANPTAAVAMAVGGSARAGGSPEDRFPGYAAHLDQIFGTGAPDDEHTRLVAGVAMALVAGWTFLEPIVLAAGDLEHLDPDAVQAEIAGIVTRLIQRETALTEPARPDRRSRRKDTP